MPDGGIVVTFADMTERVSAAEELKAMNESLERRVAERTGSKLALAKAEAEAANLGKTRFIAAASHDILQPLNAARLFTSSLVERHNRRATATTGWCQPRCLAGGGRGDFDGAARHLAARRGRHQARAQLVRRSASCLQALAVEMAPAARNRGVELTVLPSSLVVRSDRKLLRRIVQNLMSNAVKYAPGKRVLVGCRRRGGAAAHRGPRHRLRHSRRQAANDLRRVRALGQGDGRFRGSASGCPSWSASRACSITRWRCAPNRGAARRSRSPCRWRSAARRVEAAAGEVARAGELAGTTVLVIDNEQAILEGMQALLGHWRMRVMTARDGAEAAPPWPRPAIGIIVADYHLEREDGLVVIERLRARPAARSRPS
jgi:CheY-like chemotaxis protein